MAEEWRAATRSHATPLPSHQPRRAELPVNRSENYAHSWLDEARCLGSAGRAGQLATLALLRLGFNETGTCGGTEHASQRVSAMREELARSVTDTGVAAELHVLVAEGYADVVALAAGAGSTDADSSAPTPRRHRRPDGARSDTTGKGLRSTATRLTPLLRGSKPRACSRDSRRRRPTSLA